MKQIRIAFFKGPGRLRDRIIRRWTNSEYSHVEIVIPERGWWMGIYPPDSPRVRKNIIYGYNKSDWDFIDLRVTEQQLDLIIRFYNLTKGKKYDWIGMVLSHVTPFKVKHVDKWYCSEWVIYALEYAGVTKSFLATKNKMPPSLIYEMLSDLVNSYQSYILLENYTVH